MKATDKKIVELNAEELRKRLLAIEMNIKTIIGPRKEKDWVDIPVDVNREKLGNLLQSRCYCLDILFRKGPMGLEHFSKVNDYLKNLSDRMYQKGAKVYRQYLTSGMNKEFDDDFMIEADMRFVYNGEESIAEIGDEEYYGSDFNYMINVIYNLCADVPLAGASFSKSFRQTDKPQMSDQELGLDNHYDACDWGELKIWIPELEGIKICHAVNEICVYNKGYSVADLLRMNDFWCEVKAIYQHIGETYP